MNFKKSKIELLYSLTVVILLQGCLSVARISDFPKASSAIDFNRYSTEYKEKKDALWTATTSNEYYFERNMSMTENDLTNIIQYALEEKGYTIYPINPDNDNVFGKRGMYANEWNSITGVYYKMDSNKPNLKIYINTRITQDITGGWKENRAKKVGQIIENKIDSRK